MPQPNWSFFSNEDDAEIFAKALADCQRPMMSAVNYLEAAICIDCEDNLVASQAFDAFIEFTQIAIQPVSLAQTRIARRAYAQYGKGRHPAGLNF